MGSLFLSDEEIGKKDDDHKPTIIPPIRPPKWNAVSAAAAAARMPPRKLFRRIAIVLFAGLCVYLFVANIPTDVPIRDHRRPVYGQTGKGPTGKVPVAGVPVPEQPKVALPQLQPRPKEVPKAPVPVAPPPPASYNGPLKFLNLAASLHAISGTRGGFVVNKNILFAAANLKSAATLLPLACQMGLELRNYVHFALMGKTEIEIEELRAINGMDDSCQIIYHDARPDQAAISSESRLGNSVARALYHINNYMHPQIIFVDTEDEETFFLDGMRAEVPVLELSLVELPAGSGKSLTWMTKLDSSSLAAWNKVTIDILIQATVGASGSLIRLLKSLTAADFTSSAVPHLTIELPHDIDAPTAAFLESFQWPPSHSTNPTHINQLTLRRRMPRSRLTEEESSLRFLESFWPANPKNSHVLVLSPQAELSPRFYQYLKYAILEYAHSTAASQGNWPERLLGISLDLPSVHLNASEAFTPPSMKDLEDQTSAELSERSTPFLWQAPNNNAVLFLGRKWVELHSFVSKFVEIQHSSKSLDPFLEEKFVSKRYPAWLEHALKLCRARGYWTLYPSPPMASNLATVHNELWQPPEEHGLSDLAKDATEVTEIIMTSGPLLDSLPSGGNLPMFRDMPLLMWDGTLTNLGDLDEAASEYTAEFRRIIGGCEELGPKELIPHSSTQDLFCEKDGF